MIDDRRIERWEILVMRPGLLIDVTYLENPDNDCADQKLLL